MKESPKGLKYLGKTIRNPYSYMGSGTYWVSHLKKYNISSDDIKTTVLFETTDKDEFKKVAIEYSDKYNIVESKEFANLIREEGQGGTTVTKEMRPDVCKSHSKRMIDMYSNNPQKKQEQSNRWKLNNPMNSEKSRKKLSNSLKNHLVSKSTRDKISNSLKMYYKNNTVHNKGIPMADFQKEIRSKKQGNPILINDVVYNSIRHASKVLGISRYNIKKIYLKNQE